MRFSKLLLTYLSQIGAKRVFGVVGREGESINFKEVNGLDFILTRNELTAGIAAIAASRLTKKAQFCFGTLGPGATHYMTAIASAALDQYPVLFIVAQIETVSNDYNHGHQCLDSVSIAKPLCKFAKELTNQSDLKSVLTEAISSMMTPPYGPALISIPMEFLASEVLEHAALGITEKNISMGPTNKKSRIDASTISDAISLVKDSRKPLIVVGDSVLPPFCHTPTLSPTLYAANSF